MKTPTSKTALVTGAEGFIGSHLIKFLQREKWKVVGTYRLHSFEPAAPTSQMQYLQCDLRQGQRVAKVLNEAQPDYIFHLGAQSYPTVSWADPVETFESNVMGSLHLFEAIRHMQKFPVIVSACSSAEYGHVPASKIPVKEEQPLHPLHPYGISKVCLDLLARQYFLDYGIPAVNIRLFNTTGPGKTNDAPSDFVRRIVRIKKGLQPNILEVGNLKPQRAFLDVNDTVRGFYMAALKGKPGEAYNLCASKTYEVGKILETAIRIAGVKVKVQQAPSLMRPSDEKIIFGSTQKLRRDTGWKPAMTIEQTLTSMIEYWENAI